MGNPTDAAAIRRSLLEPDAFVVLFDRHHPPLRAYLARRVGAAADDLAAQVFLEAFRLRARYDLSYADARPWLYGIAAHLLRRHRRDEVRRLRAYARHGLTWVEPADLDAVVERLDGRAERGRLAQALAGLRPAEREVMALYALAELSHAEIARALGLPAGTVASRLSRARRRLRVSMSGPAPDPPPCPAEPSEVPE